MALYDYRIGAGWNLPLGSLTNIETIIPTNDVAFYAPQSWGSFDDGAVRLRPDGSIYHAGFASVHWSWRRMTRAQYQYLRDTYCSGGRSGTVTIYTRTDTEATYERYNAVMQVPKMPEANPNFTNFGCEVLMVRLVAL